MSIAPEKSPDLTSQQKRELLAELLKRKAGQPAQSHPLSLGQQALWFLHQMDPSSPAYNIMFAAHVRTDLDLPAFRASLQAVVDRHAMLRTSYQTQNGLPVMQIHRRRVAEVDVVDASNWTWEELEARLHAGADRPFDLRSGQVMRVQLYRRGEMHHVLLLVFHHMVTDFWSMDLFLDEILQLYAAQRDGMAVELRKIETQYTDYIHWQNNMLARPEGDKLFAYWQDKLSGELPTLNLPTDRPRPAIQSYRGATLAFQVDRHITSAFKTLARSEGTTLFTTLLAAFQSLLHRYSGQDDILVGTPMIGRSRAEHESIIGYFINPIVLRADLSGEPTFRQFLGRARQTVLEGLQHQDLPFPALVERIAPARDPSRSPLYQVFFVWDRPRTPQQESDGTQSAGLGKIEIGNGTGRVEIEPFQCEQRGAAFDLMMTMFEVGDRLSGTLQYNSDLYDESTVERIIGHFTTLLKSIVDAPDRPIAELPLLTPEERHQLLVEWNATEKTYPATSSIHSLVETQVAKTPDTVALLSEDGELSYTELNRRANRLAHHLRALGVGPEKLVAICMHRSPDLVVAILAALKAGGAYVPLDPAYPAERVRFMLEDSHAVALVTQEDVLESLPPHDAAVVCIDRDREKIAACRDENPNSHVAPQNLAYVIYTSGSTGKPKGVAIEHRSTIAFMHWAGEVFSPQDLAGTLFSTSVCFDLSIFEMFVPLAYGGAVVLAENALHLPSLTVCDRVTLINSVPSAMAELLRNGDLPASVRIVNLAGEPLTVKLVRQIHAQQNVEMVYDLFGPSEDTTYSTYALRRADGPYTVGKPIANTQVYLLDARMNPVPIGVPGEMYLGGAGLARGYLDRPELTAEKFVRNPFSDDPNARLYRTGDLARYMPDGNIDFLGRIDHQVKIHGFRIELGEIEAVLSRHPAVKELVVVAREDAPGDKRLVAYLVVADDHETNVTDLRNFLKESLPNHMVPGTFVMLDEMPLTPNGKIDRKRLPAPDSTRPDLAHQYVAPRNRAEAILVDIWEHVLALDRVGVHDNFFDLGGASTQSLETAALAADEGIQFPPAMLFQHPTVAELAAAVANRETHSPAAVAMQEALDENFDIETTDEDVATALDAKREKVTEPTVERANLLIESIGVYLPETVVSTAEVVRGCRKKVWFPLESMTGIKNRRKASKDELSIGMAIKAVEECLNNSKYRQQHIDLVVCCNISRCDVYWQYSCEPSSAMKLKKHFGFDNAVAFDVSNACAGMFTGVKLVEAFLAAGAIRCGMVVSGDYITGISDTAQKEIEEFIDPRLACLTVGDSGAAVILEAASNNDVGFHEVDLYTLSEYADLCLGKLTDQEHGGAIMFTDPIKHTAVAIKHSVTHAMHLFKRSPWSPEEMDYLIMHQTSARSLNDGARAINKAFKKKICNKQNTINNLAERGNTATTTHFVALWDKTLDGTLQPGNNVAFGISGSGQAVGSAIYTFDDFPDRLRRIKLDGQRPEKLPLDRPPPIPRRPDVPRVRIEAVGVVPAGADVETATIPMCELAGRNCFAASGYDRSAIDVLNFAGVYRTDTVQEPAIAALLGNALRINPSIESEDDKKTLCYDVFNSSLGLLNACDAATRMIQAGAVKTAMIFASEIEYNERHYPEELIGLKQTASALILDQSADGRTGFGHIRFRYFPELFDAHQAYGVYRDAGKYFLREEKDPALEELMVKCIGETVEEYLAQENIGISDINAVLPPQISSEFIANLSAALEVPKTRVVDVVDEHGGLNLYSSSLPYAFQTAVDRRMVKQGDVGLIVGVGSGIQVGCALYYF